MADRRTEAYQRQVTATRVSVLTLLLALFNRGSHRKEDAGAFLKSATPIINAARKQVATLTAAHLAQQFRANGTPFTAQPPFDTSTIRGVPVAEVYERPFKQVWIELANGADLETAVKAGSVRLESLITTDLQLAKTNSAQAVFQGTPRRTLYKRTLQGPGDCALCVVASTQVYTRGDLMPIHPGCDCDVDEITDIAKFRTDGVERLREAHEAVDAELGVSSPGGRQPDYRKLVITREHGEYGPMLAESRHHFDGPKDIPGKSGFDSLSPAELEHQLRVLEPLKDSAYRTTHMQKIRDRLAELTP